MVSKKWKIKLSPLPSSRPLKNQVITFTQFSTIELTTNVALQETLPAIALSQQSLLAHRADHIVLQGFWKGSVNNVAREELKAIHKDYCYSTGLPTSSSIRCESRKCINFTFYDQLESRVVRMILTDLINVYKTWICNKKTNWLHFNKHCKFWIAALFFASAIFIHFCNLKRALLWSSEKRWLFDTLHAGLLNVAVWRLVSYIQEYFR